MGSSGQSAACFRAPTSLTLVCVLCSAEGEAGAQAMEGDFDAGRASMRRHVHRKVGSELHMLPSIKNSVEFLRVKRAAQARSYMCWIFSAIPGACMNCQGCMHSMALHTGLHRAESISERPPLWQSLLRGWLGQALVLALSCAATGLSLSCQASAALQTSDSGSEEEQAEPSSSTGVTPGDLARPGARAAAPAAAAGGAEASSRRAAGSSAPPGPLQQVHVQIQPDAAAPAAALRARSGEAQPEFMTPAASLASSEGSAISEGLGAGPLASRVEQAGLPSQTAIERPRCICRSP